MNVSRSYFPGRGLEQAVTPGNDTPRPGPREHAARCLSESFLAVEVQAIFPTRITGGL